MPDASPDRHCRRPCHDCPFRADIPPYQHEADVERNLLHLINRRRLAVCHHTARCLDRPGPERVCAGFLGMVQRVGLPNDWLEEQGRRGRAVAVDSDTVFASLDEFVRSGACPDQSRGGRRLAWLLSQPAHVAAPEFRDYYLPTEE